MKAEINKWDGTKPKSFCTVKEAINKVKRKATEWEKTFANDISDNAPKYTKSSYIATCKIINSLKK